MAFGDLSAKQHLNCQFRHFGNCLDVDTLIILHIKDHKVMSFMHFTWHHLCQLRKACSADMCNDAEGATKCGEGLPLIENIPEDVKS